MDIYFSKTHEWVKVKSDGSEAIVGITQFAVDELGDINYVDLPKIDTDLILGDCAGSVESVKAASEIYSPISGTVSDVNRVLNDDPVLISMDPENKGWIYKLENIDTDELEDLMDEDAYAEYIETL